ncbi:MAG TPA: PLDc N-terminal domain-containing protein [Aggregatilineales bacterium]|nr:PLDc N-terminal domain-containing protein [Aggregatilineales bacterium]
MEAVGVTWFFSLLIFVPIILLLTTIFWVWMIVDCAVNEPPNDNNKIVWILIIIFTHIIGAIIYFLIRRPQRFQQLGR